MGWLKRVMDVLGNGDEDEYAGPHSVELSKLPEWIDQRAQHSFEKIKEKVEDEFSHFFEERRSLMKNLDTLQMAELHNPDISEREKQIMQGNRTTYISQHKQFANWIEYPDNLTLSGTAEFCRNFEDMLVKLAKSTAKGHAVISQFFGDHANRINRNVKGMSDRINRIRDTLEQADINVADLDRIKKAAIDLKTKRKFIFDLEHETKIHRTKLANSNAYKDKLMKKMEEIKLTKGYTEFKDATRRKEEEKNRMKEAEEEIHSLFSAIQRPMKKYERIVAENIKLFQRYIDDPTGALAEDDNLLIMEMLSKMKRAVNDGQLGFDEKEQEKVSAKIVLITQERLKTLRDAHTQAKRNAKRIDDAIRMNGTLQELDDMNYKVEHTDGQINLLEEKIEKAKKSLDKFDLEKMREAVVNELKEVLGTEVTLTWHQPESMVEQESEQL